MYVSIQGLSQDLENGLLIIGYIVKSLGRPLSQGRPNKFRFKP